MQLCIVHLVRASLNYVPWKARKPVAADLQSIYRAATAAEAEPGKGHPSPAPHPKNKTWSFTQKS